MTESAHNGVAIDASVYWGEDDNGDPIITGASVTDCSDGDADTDFGEGGTIDACVYVDVAAGGANIGDSAPVTVSVTSDEDSIGDSIEFTVQVSNWMASSADDAQSYAEGDTNQYTISVKNIKIDEDGNPDAISDTITIGLSTIGSGWNIDSDNSAWDKIELKAQIEYIAADGEFRKIDLLFFMQRSSYLRHSRLPSSNLSFWN